MTRLLLSICLVLALSGLYSQQSDNRDITPAERASASAIPAASPTPNEATTNAPPGTILTIPVGEAGITYADADAEELEPWGSNSFTIAEDGTYLIADPVRKRILRYRPNGSQLPPIPG